MDLMLNLDNGRTGKGILFVVSSVSGGGKTTVINRLLQNIQGLKLAVSHTTREPRKGEQDGVQYYYVSRESFENMIDEGSFLEWAEVYGHYYGTSKQSVDGLISESCDVILDIDVQGAIQIRERRSDAVLIFIVPPSEEEQSRRLEKRGTETVNQIRDRLNAARQELALVSEYDYAVRNDEIEETVSTLKSIVLSVRCRPMMGLRKILKGGNT
jgi:guanylate kinase